MDQLVCEKLSKNLDHLIFQTSLKFRWAKQKLLGPGDYFLDFLEICNFKNYPFPLSGSEQILRKSLPTLFFINIQPLHSFTSVFGLNCKMIFYIICQIGLLYKLSNPISMLAKDHLSYT